MSYSLTRDKITIEILSIKIAIVVITELTYDANDTLVIIKRKNVRINVL